MTIKWKIYLGIAIIILGIIVYQFIVIRNLKNDLHSSQNTISVLKQNELALKDSLAFLPDSIAVLRVYVKTQEQLNKELQDLFDKAKNKADKLENTVALLKIDIRQKDDIIRNLREQLYNSQFTDSTATVYIQQDFKDKGLKLDGYTFANIKNKSSFIHWNEIIIRKPNLKIALTYQPKDSTIIAYVQSNDTIEAVNTTLSDELYKLVINNVLPKETWLDRTGIETELMYIENPFINIHGYFYYKNFYITAGKKFDVFDKFSNENVFKVGYRMSINKITGYIK